jgi:hypothetical protein
MFPSIVPIRCRWRNGLPPRKKRATAVDDTRLQNNLRTNERAMLKLICSHDLHREYPGRVCAHVMDRPSFSRHHDESNQALRNFGGSPRFRSLPRIADGSTLFGRRAVAVAVAGRAGTHDLSSPLDHRSAAAERLSGRHRSTTGTYCRPGTSGHSVFGSKINGFSPYESPNSSIETYCFFALRLAVL